MRVLAFLLSVGKLIHDQFGVAGVAVLIAVLGTAIWALFRYGGDIFFWLVWRNFAKHGKVLRDAKVEVHSITPAPEPKDDDEDDEFADDLGDVPEHAGPTLNYFFVETTITPRPEAKDADGWHPSSLMLVDARHENVELFEIDGAGFIVDGWTMDGRELTEQVFHDAARIKLHIAVRPDCRRLRFLYMKEVFGDIQIPEVPAPVVAQAR